MYVHSVVMGRRPDNKIILSCLVLSRPSLCALTSSSFSPVRSYLILSLSLSLSACSHLILFLSRALLLNHPSLFPFLPPLSKSSSVTILVENKVQEWPVWKVLTPDVWYTSFSSLHCTSVWGEWMGWWVYIICAEEILILSLYRCIESCWLHFHTI